MKYTFSGRVGWGIIIALMTILCFIMHPYAQKIQNKEQLLDKKKQIEKEIEYYKSLLEETKKSKDISLNHLVLLKNQISKREQLIDEINNEILLLEQNINNNNKEIQKYNEQLNALKAEYAKLIYYAYKNRNAYSRLMFIFASKDFNQAFRRMKYLQLYNEYLKRQALLIANTKIEISKKNEELEKQKIAKSELLLASQNEKSKLDKEKEQKDKDLKRLKSKEAELRKKLKQKEQEAATLKKKIEAAIAEEIKKSASKTNKTVTATTTVKNVMTPEEKLVSDNFSSNKGKLPWPVERGTITGYFGEHPHPVLDGIVVKNNGIDISTNKGSYARAVFSGIVSGIVNITNNNIAVIIRHGEFFSVYSNLQSVFVKKNETVSTKQNIGLIYTNDEESKTELHFEIWQGKMLCNPIEWLAGK